jgi:hypothetical protein
MNEAAGIGQRALEGFAAFLASVFGWTREGGETAIFAGVVVALVALKLTGWLGRRSPPRKRRLPRGL